MKPDSQFQAMIATLLQNRQSSITNADIVKHQNNETTFYAVTTIVLNNNSIISQSQPFSDQTIIEINKGANTLKIVESETRSRQYQRTSPLELTSVQGKNLVYWEVENSYNQKFTVVKLMSPDGYVQIKLIASGNITQTVYTVCELPMHMIPK